MVRYLFLYLYRDEPRRQATKAAIMSVTGAFCGMVEEALEVAGAVVEGIVIANVNVNVTGIVDLVMGLVMGVAGSAGMEVGMRVADKDGRQAVRLWGGRGEIAVVSSMIVGCQCDDSVSVSR